MGDSSTISSSSAPMSSTLTLSSESQPPVDLVSGFIGTSPAIIIWIPKSARKQCTTILTKLVSAVVSKPTSTPDWERLLSYDRTILKKPDRGGAKRNLGNLLTRRCATFFVNRIETSVHEQDPTARKRSKGKGRTVKDEGVGLK
jgi:hypothetical protein